jgi:trigger factor
MIENLEAQIRERKAVDFILEKASFEDVPDQWTPPENSHTVDLALCELGAVSEPVVEEEGAG